MYTVGIGLDEGEGVSVYKEGILRVRVKVSDKVLSVKLMIIVSYAVRIGSREALICTVFCSVSKNSGMEYASLTLVIANILTAKNEGCSYSRSLFKGSLILCYSAYFIEVNSMLTDGKNVLFPA